VDIEKKIEVPTNLVNLLVILAFISGILQISFIPDKTGIIESVFSALVFILNPNLYISTPIESSFLYILVIYLASVYIVYPIVLGFIMELNVDRKTVVLMILSFTIIFWFGVPLLFDELGEAGLGAIIFYAILPLNVFTFLLIGMDLGVRGLAIETVLRVDSITAFIKNDEFNGLTYLIITGLSILFGLLNFIKWSDVFNFTLLFKMMCFTM
jgi:hypothetical protein